MDSGVRLPALEGDSLCVHFFQCLLRPSGMPTVPSLTIPDTVVFEAGHPRWWYRCDPDNGDVRRSAAGKELQAQALLEYFVKRAPSSRGRRLGAVAQLVYAAPARGGESPQVAVDHLDEAALGEFLRCNTDPRRRHSLLQTVVLPAELKYATMQVMWARRVSIVRRRMSRIMLTDTQAPLPRRFSTFDGPDFYSTEVQCAPETREKLLQCCDSIYDHVAKSFHAKISTMHLFFVPSETGPPCLLWCGSLFLVAPLPAPQPIIVRNPDGTETRLPSAPPGPPTVPPTLLRGPRFVEEKGTMPEALLAAQVTEADRRFIELRATAPNGPEMRRMPGDGEASAAANAAAATNTKRTDATAAAQAAALDCAGDDAAAAAWATARFRRWHDIAPVVSTAHQRLSGAETAAKQQVADCFYRGWCDRQSRDGCPDDDGAVRLILPATVADLLGGDSTVVEMFQAVGLPPPERVPWGDGAEDFNYVADVAPPHAADVATGGAGGRVHPLPAMLNAAVAFVEQRMDERRRNLRAECLPAVLDDIAQAVIDGDF